jgi:hypothetical protein
MWQAVFLLESTRQETGLEDDVTIPVIGYSTVVNNEKVWFLLRVNVADTS